ncbi:protein SCO1 [uncultured Gammaproteobacteria bacterium]
MAANKLKFVLALVIGSVVAGGLLWWQFQRVGEQSSPTITLGGPFELTDHTGKAVTEATYHGHPVLLYFGYTYCPDVCPSELQTMAQALDRLGPDGTDIQPLLITIDPARDTPAHLSDYVSLFHPRLIGLTGTPAQIAAVARAYRVYFARGPAPAPVKDGDGGAYTMDHSSFVYLIGPQGQFLALFSRAMAPERMAEEIRAKLRR